MAKTHNHYVPVYYLNGFANPLDGKIFMYFKSKREVVSTNATSVANKLHYWSNATEKYLADCVEGPANPVLDKIRKRQSINDLDKWRLSSYLVTMLKRVPAGRKRMLARAPIAMKNMVANLEANMDRLRKTHPSEAEAAQRLLNAIAASPQEFLDNIPAVWEQVISPEMTKEIVNVIHDMTWTFLTYTGKRGFVTSDNPVVYTTSKGMRPPEGELVFPVSPNIALWTSWINRKDGLYMPTREDVVNYSNYWTVASAADYIFYCGHKNWIQALIKKVTKAARKDSPEA